MTKKTCFVISPIGDDGSEERMRADRFLMLIKEIAELHNLEAFRADEVFGTSDINADVVDRILYSDLCIIDLSGLNPNVMYEFGIRYQTGLPYVVCAINGTKLPFDVITKRTIFYGDLDHTQDYRAAKEKIRSFIRPYEDNDYNKVSAINISDIYNSLQVLIGKIERIEKFNSSTSLDHSKAPTINSSLENEIDELITQLGPSQAFRYAISTNQMKLAEILLDYCRNQPQEYLLNKLCALATLGSDKAAEELKQYLNDDNTELEFDTIKEIIGCLVTCYNAQDTEDQHFEEMNEYFEKALSIATTNKQRAAILNQKQRLYAGDKRYDQAKEIIEQAISIDDEEAAYYYNYASILKALKDDEAVVYAKKAVDMTQNNDDDDYLALYCTLLRESNDPVNAELYDLYMRRLEKISPLKAKLIRLGK